MSTGSEPHHSAGTVDSPDVDPGDDAPNREGGARAKNALAVVGILALLASAVVGSDLFGLRGRIFGSARPEPRPAAVSRRADAPTETAVEPQKTVLRSQPWWQSVTLLTGVGPMTAPAFDIAGDAVQWRAKWTCQAGHLKVVAPGRSRPVVDVNCPGAGTGYATATGSVGLEVTAEGPWELHVDQQVDVPLNEPPLPAMTAPGAVVVSTGTFYRIDQTGTGTVTLYRLPDGTYALRLDDFFVTANSELEVRLSALEEPKTSGQFADAPSALVSPLEVTVGSLNFALPAGVDPNQYKSVVIWCRLINSAYSGATLRPAR
ncbi:MAG: DM13 domain-containing protein [Actinomycetota bacterium]|nr:DM13 domain-containing protein [Actinomycetota bacterium]